MWSVDAQYIEEWVSTLDEESREQLFAALTVFKEVGPNLGRPLVDTVANSRHRNMKVLRPGSAGGSEIRVLFAFDPKRKAILLVAGNKAGQWTRWYKRNIPKADQIYDRHLGKVKGERSR